MRFFVIIASLSYLAFSVTAVIDKFLLRKTIPQPATYAFYIGALNALALLLIPFGFAVPGGKIIFFALLSGVLFIFGLLTYFESLKRNDASSVLPVLGATVPLATYVLSFLFIGERLGIRDFIGIFLLIAGTVSITGGLPHPGRDRRWLAYAFISSLLFAASSALTKPVYVDQSFISGLIWTRLGSVLGAGLLLLGHDYRDKIFHTAGGLTRPVGLLFLIGQVIGSVGAVLQNYGYSLGSITIVNALQGVQFAFILVFTWIISRWYPKFLEEDFSARASSFKVAALILISFGLVLVA